MQRTTICLAGLAMMSAGFALADGATALFGGKAVAIEQTLPDPNDLWVSPDDLTRINGFVVKPEGIC